MTDGKPTNRSDSDHGGSPTPREDVRKHMEKHGHEDDSDGDLSSDPKGEGNIGQPHPKRH